MAELKNLDLLSSASRRSFLKGSTAAVVGGSLVATLGASRAAHAAGDGTLKVGLIGAGGRGSGAARNAVNADPNVKLTAVADLFPDRLEQSLKMLKKPLGDKFAVTEETAFSGFDAYKHVIDSGVDVVILAEPPHYRPSHLRYAIEQGKHVFCEKPVAVDAPGIRSVLETAALAKEKDVSIVSGLCWRYDQGVRETIKRIQDGAIGDVTSIQSNYLTGTLWHRGDKPEWSEMEYQNRNWYYFTWLSGDHIAEQFIHSLDKAMWLNGDVPPVKCVGLGGRQVRTDEKWGNIYDHHAVCYEWATGVKCYAYTRQMKGCKNNVEDYIQGTKGTSLVLKHQITPDSGDSWKFEGKKPSMYDHEHVELFQGIRSGNHLNNGQYMCYSTMLAIMGRMACYTGQEVTWEMAMNSQQDLSPAKYEWGDNPVQPVAMPGVTKFV